jgi:fatty-acyl-CoA synthase
MEIIPGISIAYGTTETSPATMQTAPDDSLEARVATVGRTHPHIEAKVIDPVTGETVARGEAGELCTRGYSTMLGYWGQPEKTAETIDEEGWIHSGDLVVMDDDGYVAITGRLKDLVMRGGENIYPREIEEFLYTHPDIMDAQVIGVPSETYGEEVMAWLRMEEGAEPLTADDVRAFCTGRLAHYKIPRYVQVTDEFPMTVSGKVRKVDLRKRAEEILALTTD